MKTDGEKLRLLIRGSGLSQAEAALKMGVSRQTLNTYFNRAELPSDVLQIVKDRLGLIVNPSPIDKFEESKKEYKKQGYTDSLPNLSSDQSNTLLMAINSATYANTELLVELLSNQTGVPIQEVRSKANRLTHEKMRLVEQVIDKLIGDTYNNNNK